MWTGRTAVSTEILAAHLANDRAERASISMSQHDGMCAKWSRTMMEIAIGNDMSVSINDSDGDGKLYRYISINDLRDHPYGGPEDYNGCALDVGQLDALIAALNELRAHINEPTRFECDCPIARKGRK